MQTQTLNILLLQPLVQFHWCFWTVAGSVCLWTTTAQYRAVCILFFVIFFFFYQWHHSLSQEQRKLNTAGSMGEKWDGERHSAKHNCSSHQCVVFLPACVCVFLCVRSLSVCHTPLPPPVCRAHFLHKLPPRYFMSESFYSSHLRTHFSV